MSDEKRGKKRKKAYYQKCHKRVSNYHVLAAKMQGVLITCNQHEREAVTEAYHLLNEYADKLFGAEKRESNVITDEKTNTIDIEDELANEIALLKESKNERRFQNVRCRVGNCIFIKTNIPDVCRLVYTILSDAASTGVLRTRFCLRITPVIATCGANLESIRKTASEIFSEYFEVAHGHSVTYSIIFKARNNSSVSRMDVISDLARCIEGMNPLNRTDHSDPDCTVLVDVLCTVCCVSVVKDYKKFRRYNIHEVAMAQKDRGDLDDHTAVYRGCKTVSSNTTDKDCLDATGKVDDQTIGCESDANTTEKCVDETEAKDSDQRLGSVITEDD